MRRLTETIQAAASRRFPRLRYRSEDGATLVFVAITLVALFALASFAIDFGLLYAERRDLQNGADAAALAIAEDCARGQCDPAYDEYDVAEVYVDANARDNTAWAQQVDLDLSERKVTVYNATENGDGSHELRLLFAGVVGFNDFTVGADATVVWGHPRQLATIPLIISECEWIKTEDGWPAGDADTLPSDKHIVGASYDVDGVTTARIQFHDGNATDPCAAQAGKDGIFDENGDNLLPGGFGWLDTDGNCVATVYGVDSDADTYGWVAADTGSSPSTGCDPEDVRAMLLDMEHNVGRTVMIPYFIDLWTGPSNGSGPCGDNGKCYRIGGYGAFHAVGYKFSGGKSPKPNNYIGYVDPPLDAAPCTGGGEKDMRCLEGYFVQTASTTGGGDLGGEDRGVLVIKFAD
jgi:Flp pilus assembly protein TadG